MPKHIAFTAPSSFNIRLKVLVGSERRFTHKLVGGFFFGALGGAAAKDAGNAIVDGMGIDRKAVASTGRTLAGLSGLFSSSDSGNDKVPDSNWKPKSISELFKGN